MSTESTQTQTTSQSTSPWSVQQPYLKQAWNQASSNLTSDNANTYSGPQVAQFSPEQLALFRQMTGYGGTTGNADATSAAGANAATAGSNAITDALNAYKNYTPTGGTDSNIAAATAYANNPATDGMIDAAMRDARRNVSESALPQVARDAATSGNTMSSRRAISEGLIERGLADKTADVSANIRGQQFNQGLALAENGRQADNSAMLSALQGRAGAGVSALGAGAGALGSGTDTLSNLCQRAANFP